MCPGAVIHRTVPWSSYLGIMGLGLLFKVQCNVCSTYLSYEKDFNANESEATLKSRRLNCNCCCLSDRPRERESDRRFGKPAVHGRIKPHHPPTIYTTKIFSIHASSFVFNLSLSLSLYLHLFVLYSYSISSYISCHLCHLTTYIVIWNCWYLDLNCITSGDFHVNIFFCVIFGQIAVNNRIFTIYVGLLLAKFWTNLCYGVGSFIEQAPVWVWSNQSANCVTAISVLFLPLSFVWVSSIFLSLSLPSIFPSSIWVPLYFSLWLLRVCYT